MVTETYLPFDWSDEDPREYSSALWAIMQRNLTRDGVAVGIDQQLKVIPSDPAAMTVDVQDGAAFVQGRFYELREGPKVLDLDEADPDNDRIDRIVLRLDLDADEKTIKALVKTGEPASDPEPPSLTQDLDNDLWELSLARVYVGAGVTSVGDGDITDERNEYDVCGWSVHPAMADMELTSIMLQS